MDDSKILQNFRNVRTGLHNLVKGMDGERILVVPAGFSNNILWNFGHVMTDGAEMLYRSNNLDSPVPEKYRALFLADTSPKSWDATPDVEQLIGISEVFTDAVTSDYESGLFENFDGAKVESAWPLGSIEEAITYHTIHEALHMGYIMALNKVI